MSTNTITEAPALADLLADLPAPRYGHYHGLAFNDPESQRATFAALRTRFPDAPVTMEALAKNVTITVDLADGGILRVSFDPTYVGEAREVTRTEYVIDGIVAR